MRKYAVCIRKFERRLNIAISDILDIGVFGLKKILRIERKTMTPSLQYMTRGAVGR
jgi:hypothetical protein